ncbi:hypothetical protein LP123_02150 [Moraxella bovis]|uniref:Lipoprotein n=1 Tax=Moraxella bovis TaxID=476 RepID=A0AAX3ETG4_MORBO|nr:hypothetical protein [Moraxella bovis]AWY21193.1 hypothetical protein DQF64_12300 [Moraxella bovis]OOR87226.1 hypothetical protein B0182_12955 [Moraxella bovis]UYZ68172.1 hypothetical protein LP122_10485 [Moraxella bovis]UYZ70555.1 hypothetical protein LP089_10645 [Moraxella bovis]UYZ73525.1 hypothetical protein LP105_02030 [Moraxella bovis]
MKTNQLIGCAIKALGFLFVFLIQACKANDIQVTICEPDYQSISYCNKEFFKKLQNKKKEKPDFDLNKYLIISKIPLNNRKDKIFSYYFAVFDPKNNVLFPLTLVVTNFSNQDGYMINNPPTIRYWKDNDLICVSGNIISYRNSYENIENYCYRFQEDIKDVILINNNI